MRLYLRVTEGPENGREAIIEAGESLIVGRASEASMFLGGDAELSRLHFSIIPHEGTFAVKDLNSANGTELNGEEIQWAPLKDGDRIMAGLTGFTVFVEGILGAPNRALDQTVQLVQPAAPTAIHRTKKDLDVGPAIRAVILVVISGPHKGDQHLIDRGTAAVIGRAEEATIQLDEDDELSKVHFSVAFKGKHLTLKDLGSVNGTKVNKVRVEKTRLHSGDVIEAGSSKIHVQYQRNPLDDDFEEDDAAAAGDFRHLTDTHMIQFDTPEEDT
jgi:pSer/pThr/pTyr-binding forkhead associated (FHA) protein